MVNRCQFYFDGLSRPAVGGTFEAIQSCDHCHLPLGAGDSWSIVNGVVTCSGCELKRKRCRCGRQFGPGGPFNLRGQNACRYCVLDDLGGKIEIAKHQADYRRWRRNVDRAAIAWALVIAAWLVYQAVK